MKKFSLILFSVCLVIVLAFLSIRSFIETGPEFGFTWLNQLLFKNKSIALPVNPDDPKVQIARLTYRLEGNLNEVKKIKDNQYELDTDIKVSGLPKVIIGRVVPIFFYNTNTNSTLQANINDLKPGRRIQIFYVYGLKNNSWAIMRVNILDQVK